MRWLVAVAILVVACKRTAPDARTPTPPTAEEAKQTAIAFAEKLTPCDRAALNKMIDVDLLIDRAIAGRSVRRSDLNEARGTLVKTLCDSLGDSWRAQLVRVNTIGGVPKPLVRLTSDAGIEYLELELDKHDGEIRIADMLVYTRGEQMSKTMTEMIDTLLAKDDRYAVMSAASSIQHVQQLVLAEKWREAYDAIQALPASLRNTKQVRHVEVRAASGLDDDDIYVKTIEAYAAAFPNDPSLDLVRIDAEYIRKRFDKVLELLDSLDKRIGGDPYLDAMRASTLADAGKLDKGLEYAKKATTNVPDLPDVWRTQLTLQVAAGHNRGALKTLETLQQKFKELPDEATLRADPRWAALADTAEYAAWQKR